MRISNLKSFFGTVAASLLSFAFLSGTAGAATSDADFQEALKVFHEAQAGDKSAVERAADMFEDLLKKDPGHPALIAYQGAATSIKGRTTMLPWKKIGFTEDGLALMDKALASLRPEHDTTLINKTPVSLQAKLTAAGTFCGVPAMFNRGPRCEKLLGELKSSPLLAQATPNFQGSLLLLTAKRAVKDSKPEEARKALSEIVDRGLPQADVAKTQLAELKS